MNEKNAIMGFYVSLSCLAKMFLFGVTITSVHVTAYPQKSFIDDSNRLLPSIQSIASLYLREFDREQIELKSEHGCPQTSVKARGSYYLSQFLSPDLFTKTDLLEYLVRKTVVLRQWQIMELDADLEFCLKNNQFYENYAPYAAALQTILYFQVALMTTKRHIRMRYLAPISFQKLPILSASGLFSSDVLHDSEPPIQLLNKLAEIPENDIPKLRILLENAIKMNDKWKPGPYNWNNYVQYAKELVQIFRTDLLDDLKRNMTEIQRITTISRQSSENDNDGPNTTAENVSS